MNATIADMREVRDMVEQTVRDHRREGRKLAHACELAGQELGIAPRRVVMYRAGELVRPPQGRWRAAWEAEAARIRDGFERHLDLKAARLAEEAAALAARRRG